jgi:hypothetical protein
MDSLPIGSLQSWLITAAAALGPLIALLVGFVGTDQWLRWQLNERHGCTPLEDTKVRKSRRDGASGHLLVLLTQGRRRNLRQPAHEPWRGCEFFRDG